MFALPGEELDTLRGGDRCKLSDTELLLLFCIVGPWRSSKDFMTPSVRLSMEAIWRNDVSIEYTEFCGEFPSLLRFVDVFSYFGGDLLLFIEVGPQGLFSLLLFLRFGFFILEGHVFFIFVGNDVFWRFVDLAHVNIGLSF